MGSRPLLMCPPRLRQHVLRVPPEPAVGVVGLGTDCCPTIREAYGRHAPNEAGKSSLHKLDLFDESGAF